MLYLLGTLVTAELWIGMAIGVVMSGLIKKVLKWAWNLIPGVPKIG